MVTWSKALPTRGPPWPAPSPQPAECLTLGRVSRILRSKVGASRGAADVLSGRSGKQILIGDENYVSVPVVPLLNHFVCSGAHTPGLSSLSCHEIDADTTQA